MKKLFVSIVVIAMLAMPFCGLAEGYMPKEIKVTVEETASYPMVILDENQEFVTVKNLTECMNHLVRSYSYNCNTYIRGIINDGTVIRGARGLAPLVKVGDYYFGLTPENIEVEIFENCKPLVSEILLNIVGTEEISNISVMAATIRLETYGGAHNFYNDITRRVYVGNGYVVNQNSYFEIWAGDLDLNEELELGLIPSSSGYSTVTVNEDNSNSNNNVDVDVNVDVNTEVNTSININTNTSVNVNTETEIVKSNSGGCSTNNTVVNNGNNNNITNTITKVNGNDNVITTVNNTSTNVSLFAVTLNNNSNNVNVNTGTQTICAPTIKMMKDSKPNNNTHCC